MTRIRKVTALNRVLPQGMKTIGFALEWEEELRQADLVGMQAEVLDHSYEPQVPAQKRTVTKIYLQDAAVIQNEPEQEAKKEKGRYLILETDPDDAAAFAIGHYTMAGEFTPVGPPPLGFEENHSLTEKGREKRPEDRKEDKKDHNKPNDPGNGPGKDFGYTGLKPLNIEIRITGHDGSGNVFQESFSGYCPDWVCPELERFTVREYKGLPYDLFIPEDYDPSRKYPVVLFITDAGGRGTYEKLPLVQGIGAMVWTSPEDQKRHPCFVVTPVFGPEDILTHDDFTFDKRMYLAKEILDSLQEEFSIDPKQIYTTGQSMGCMSSCQLMIEWPDYFAGAMLVAGQWDPEKSAAAMKDKHVWILVSENDRKAHPGMDAVTEAIEHQGGQVDRFVWDAKVSDEKLETLAREAASTAADIKYTLFKGSSVVPDGMDDGPGSNHTCTWAVAYRISAVRDWLFTTGKGEQ